MGIIISYKIVSHTTKEQSPYLKSLFNRLLAVREIFLGLQAQNFYAIQIQVTAGREEQ